MIDVPADWSGGIEELVGEANRRLARLLPADRAARPKDEVNPRLVRHYTTQGLLPAPRREGRDARYARVHLMALLALRRLMADGLGGKALEAALGGRDERALERLAVEGALQGGGEAMVPADNEALRFIQTLSQAAPAVDSSAPRSHLAGGLGLPLPIQRQRTGSARSVRTRISHTTRAVIRPNLELLIGSEFQWPQSEREWRALLQDISATLHDVHQAEK